MIAHTDVPGTGGRRTILLGGGLRLFAWQVGAAQATRVVVAY